MLQLYECGGNVDIYLSLQENPYPQQKEVGDLDIRVSKFSIYLNAIKEKPLGLE